jgi:hypothetical protein
MTASTTTSDMLALATIFRTAVNAGLPEDQVPVLTEQADMLLAAKLGANRVALAAELLHYAMHGGIDACIVAAEQRALADPQPAWRSGTAHSAAARMHAVQDALTVQPQPQQQAAETPTTTYYHVRVRYYDGITSFQNEHHYCTPHADKAAAAQQEFAGWRRAEIATWTHGPGSHTPGRQAAAHENGAQPPLCPATPDPEAASIVPAGALANLRPETHYHPIYGTDIAALQRFEQDHAIAQQTAYAYCEDASRAAHAIADPQRQAAGTLACSDTACPVRYTYAPTDATSHDSSAGPEGNTDQPCRECSTHEVYVLGTDRVICRLLSKIAKDDGYTLVKQPLPTTIVVQEDTGYITVEINNETGESTTIRKPFDADEYLKALARVAYQPAMR